MHLSKVAWVTGASSGIGEEIAKQLANQGYSVVLSARGIDKLEAIRLTLPESSRHIVVPLDLEEIDSFESKKDFVLKHYGRIDLLVNNGGISQRSTAYDTTLDVDRRIMEVNYFGNIALTKVVLPVFRHQKSGQILVVSSIAGKFGFYLRSAYSASKHALHGFYESLRLEEAAHGIKVTIACPGKINTNISVNALTAKGNSHGEMDHNQATGMPASVCATQMIAALKANQFEVLIGNKEIKAVTLKRFLPKLFWKVISKQSPT